MAQYKTPDVYVVEKSLMPPSVAEVATAIPAFIGYTEKIEDSKGESICNIPKRVTNMVEYEKIFGGPYLESFIVQQPRNSDELVLDKETPKLANFFLYQALSHFFANGGGACYIVSIGKSVDTTTKEEAAFTAGIDTLKKIDEVTLISCPESVLLAEATHYVVQTYSLQHAKACQDRFALLDVSMDLDTPRDIRSDATAFRDNVAGTTDELKYAACYYPYLSTLIARSYAEKNVEVSYYKEGAGMSTTVMMNQLNDPTDPEVSTAIYNEVKTVLSQNYLILPPTPAIAGIMAKTDAERGVWKAPANVPVTKVAEPVVAIDNSEQEDLNVDVIAGKSINAIREFVGKGTLVWGARTLAGNDNEWRYVPVRRLFNMVEESIQQSTAFAVFEPNTPFTWLKIKTMIESYLESLWQQGALFGTTPEQAFFVNVGLGQTMTEDDINNGLMKIDIGLAAVRPAEFIILTFMHKALES